MYRIADPVERLEYENHWDKAYNAFRKNQFKETIAELNRMSDILKRNGQILPPFAKKTLGDCYKAIGKTREAISLYTWIITTVENEKDEKGQVDVKKNRQKYQQVLNDTKTALMDLGYPA